MKNLIEVNNICFIRGYLDPEQCAVTGKWTAWNPRTKKWVMVRWNNSKVLKPIKKK